MLIDNDVILKLCLYGLQEDLIEAIGAPPPGMLAIGRFTLRDIVARSEFMEDRERAERELIEALEKLELLSPNEQEIELAVTYEEQAARQGLEMDTGESQLLAMLVERNLQLLLTGDKRAIVATHGLEIEQCSGKIACLEQAINTLLDRCEVSRMRASICEKAQVDKAVTSCFACHAAAVTLADIKEGLASYIRYLRDRCGKTLAAGDDLNAYCGAAS